MAMAHGEVSSAVPNIAAPDLTTSDYIGALLPMIGANEKPHGLANPASEYFVPSVRLDCSLDMSQSLGQVLLKHYAALKDQVTWCCTVLAQTGFRYAYRLGANSV
jgi:hypothetical protein